MLQVFDEMPHEELAVDVDCSQGLSIDRHQQQVA
jgi:hypothetical protein